jgi:polysaccharide pyruvyl transferase WcaK-like protein
MSTGSIPSRSADTATPEEVLDQLSRIITRGSRVLVVGGYGCGNVGDEAILSVLLDDIRSLGGVPRVVSVRPHETRVLHRAGAVPASPVALLRALVAADVVAIGGGGIFSAYMGPRSRHLPWVARLARVMRRRVVFRALGVYASTPASVARGLVAAMESADLVTVRDDASASALRAFGLQRRLLIEDDPALRIAAPNTGVRHPGTLGLAVRRVRDPECQRRLERELVAFIDALVASGRRPVLLPFCEHPAEPIEQDDAYARELAARSRHRDLSEVAPSGIAPAHMLALVQSLDAIVAMRFHALVFAIVAHVPVIALPYDDKCVSFAMSHGIAALDMRALTHEGLLAAVDSMTVAVAA